MPEFQVVDHGSRWIIVQADNESDARAKAKNAEYDEWEFESDMDNLFIEELE